MGETLVVKPGEKITVEMEMTIPAKNNSPYSFNNPLLTQVDNPSAAEQTVA